MIQARNSIRSLSSNQLIQSLSKSRNCEEVDVEPSVIGITPKHSIDDVRKEKASCKDPADDILKDELHNFVWNSQDINNLAEDMHNIEILHYVIGHILHRFVDCTYCLENMCCTEITSTLLKNKQYEDCHLVQHKMPKLISHLTQIQAFVLSSLPQVGHLPKISSILFSEIQDNLCIDFDFHSDSCRKELYKKLMLGIVQFYIRLYCKRTNDTLSNESVINKNKNKVKRWTR